MFKLDDLKTGDRVVLRDGRFMVVLKNTAVGNVISSFDGGSFMALGSYTQSLKVVSYPRLKSWTCNESCKPLHLSRCQSIR